MTYCVAISVGAGMVFCSDSRTNAGVDQVSTYSKMFRFELGPERNFVVLTAGNLATTQSTMAQLKKDIRQQSAVNLNTVMSVGDAADYLGEVSKSVQDRHGLGGQGGFQASFILGGQIAGMDHRIVHEQQGHAVPADRRTQVRQADPRPHPEHRHHARNRRNLRARVDGLDDAQ
jgi:putative proteasome-type protease